MSAEAAAELEAKTVKVGTEADLEAKRVKVGTEVEMEADTVKAGTMGGMATVEGSVVLEVPRAAVVAKGKERTRWESRHQNMVPRKLYSVDSLHSHMFLCNLCRSRKNRFATFSRSPRNSHLPPHRNCKLEGYNIHRNCWLRSRWLDVRVLW